MGDDKKDSDGAGVPGERSERFTDLSPAERWLAGIVGLLGAAGGGVAVYLSANQAGTTTLLLVSFLFLLLAVQGTPIARVSKDGGVELGRVVRNRVDRSLREGDTEQAVAEATRARELAPSIEGTPEYAAAVVDIANASAGAADYERRVISAVWRVIPDGWGIVQVEGPDEWDGSVVDEDGKLRLRIETRYAKSLSGAGVATIISRIRRRQQRSPGSVLLVTNAAVDSDDAIRYQEHGIQVATWRDQRDDDALRKQIVQQ